MAGKRKGLPDWAYYLLAVAMTALTIPMYRYMHVHASDGNLQPVDTALTQASFYDTASQPAADSSPGRRRLRPGELCKAGYVILKHGNTYSQGLDAEGQPLRCADGHLIDG
ncbi:hypothetical protein ACFFJT_14215 [Dyella flava]|uniref:Uncharacterized protein n=1 Tax=Dyella flava TaxID=1920170 RepID=A0ABS2K2F9_9GAMM|nr:hypothetical protein [Dyella flava]MBM7125089.1 hypothetical protein [Dyella flava]GLQ51962.1 hypothetical protein GCM10010872_34110 [Dyella flava]